MALTFQLPEGTEPISLDSFEPSQHFSYADYEQPMDVKKTDGKGSQESFEQDLDELVHGGTTDIEKEPEQTLDPPEVAVQEEVDMISQEGLTHEIMAELAQDTLEPTILEDPPRELDMSDIPNQEAAVTSFEEATSPSVKEDSFHQSDVVEGLQHETDAEEGTARDSTTPYPESQDEKPEGATAAAMHEVTEPTVQRTSSRKPDFMEYLQKKTDAREGAARSSTSPGPSTQNEESQEQPTGTAMQEHQKGLTPGRDSQEIFEPISKTAQSPNINLGPSILDAKSDDAIGGRQTADQLKRTCMEQLTMAKILMAAKSNAERQISPTAEASHDQGDANPETDPNLETRYRKAEREYRRRQQNGALTADYQLCFDRLGSQYDAQMSFLREDQEDQDDENRLFVNQSARPKRKLDAQDTSTKNDKDISSTGPRKRRKRRGPINLEAHNNLRPTNLFDDALAAEGIQDQLTFDANTSRKRAWSELQERVPKEALTKFRADRRRIEDSIKNFQGQGVVKPHDSGHWLVQGLKTPLKHHQIIQAGWMRGREATGKPKGGIVADTMGLGKTLSALALIVNSRPRDPVYEGPRATLVVVPASLTAQWASEVKKHCVKEMAHKKFGCGAVQIFRDRDSSSFDADDFNVSDIIITTYHDVMKSWPECKYPDGLTDEERRRYFQEEYEEKRGPLHRVKWLRVILDEGHIIRNSDSRTAKGCHNLVARNRWLLSATPMQNGARDLYSIFTFIQHPRVLSMTFDSFKREYCMGKEATTYGSLSQELLSCMARFEHKDTLVGGRLVTLPSVRRVSPCLVFSPLERDVYEICQKRFRERVHTVVSANGSVQTKMLNVLSMITLLRQLTAYPLMLPANLSKWLKKEDFDAIGAAIDAQRRSKWLGARTIHTLRRLVRDGRSQLETMSPGDDLESEEVMQPAVAGKQSTKAGTGKKFGKPTNKTYNKFLLALKGSADPTCAVCKRIPSQPILTSCQHLYCHAHLEDLMHKDARNSQGPTTTECVVPDCGQTIEESREASEDAGLSRWRNEEEDLLPSTKTLAVKAQILEWWDGERGGDKDKKVIIFTQWRAMVVILEKLCKIEKWGYTTLHGGLRPKARTESLDRFRSDPRTKILISTLHTGGLGLNLTVASGVINVDPWWHDAAEEQAFGRVYRIGQTKKTQFTNLAVKGTIDDRLKEIKLRKKTEITAILKGHKNSNLRTLMELLEPVSDSQSGEEDYPMEDYEDEEEAGE